MSAKEILIMAWDTATPLCTIALAKVGEDGKAEVLGEFQSYEGMHSRILPPEAARLLDGAGLAAKDLDLLAVGRGPGSFTGLRTGLALAKGMSMGANVPVLGISTLEVLAAMILENNSQALAAPVIDARHQEIFGAVYRIGPFDGSGLSLECLAEPKPMKPDSFTDFVTLAAGGLEVKIAGPALELTGRESAEGKIWPDNLQADLSITAPSAVMLARLAAVRFMNGELGDNPALPLYIRQPDIWPSGVVMQ